MRTEIDRLSDRRYRARTKQVKQYFYALVGVQCLFCSSTEHLVCHRKDFANHERLANLTLVQLRAEKVDDYARLCFGCHYGVHWAHEYLNLSWDELAEGRWFKSNSRYSGKERTMDCEKWLRCAEFQNLLDRDNLPCSAEQIAKLCGPCPRRVPIRWWANSQAESRAEPLDKIRKIC